MPKKLPPLPLLVLVFCHLALPSIADTADDFEPPRNPHLADSPWPMSHRNPYNQASSPYPGPKKSAGSVSTARFLEQCPVSITLVLGTKNSAGRYSTWGNCKGTVFKINANNGAWESVAQIPKGEEGARHISGAYTLLDADNVYFLPHGKRLLGFGEDVLGEAHSALFLAKTFTLPASLKLAEDEDLVGINMTYDGWLASVSRYGTVVLVHRKSGTVKSLKIASQEEISNSLAVDEEGGIYALTDAALYRLHWDGTTLALSWRAPYESFAEPLPGRLGLGSGTTPTLMGTGKQDKLVVIADGQKLMHLVGYWRSELPPGITDRVAGKIPITFGKSGLERSITEQSVLVSGYGAVVVNNDYGPRKTGKVHNFFTILNSNTKKIAPYGIERFDWDDITKSWKKRWANSHLSAPNGIPSMSRATGLIYYLGQESEDWTFEGAAWETGELAFRHRLTRANKYNSFYAATEVGYDATLLSGTFGGALQLSMELIRE